MKLEKNLLYSGSDDKTVRIWELTQLMHVFTIKVHKKPVMDILIIQETGHLVTCSIDGTIKIWNHPKKEELKVIRKPGK